MDLRELLLGKLPEVLDDAQKENKIHNLLSSMRREGLIDRFGPRAHARWRLVKSGSAVETNKES